uniref:Uncharacterized protein n=1 Tax=Magallana gigas TaxID=29159 RepID=K1QW87_MAGGI
MFSGICLYLYKRYSRVYSYNCSHFRYGCPDSNYFTSEVYNYISKGKNEINIENGNGELNSLIEKPKLCEVDTTKKVVCANLDANVESFDYVTGKEGWGHS